MLNWVSWQPMGPNKFGISEASYYQTLLNKRFELKLGYLANSWEFVNYSVGGSLASSVFGPSGSIPIQGGMSNNETPTPGANLTVNVTDKFYVKGGVQRSVNPDGLQAEIKYNQRGFKWNTPNAGTLSIGEVGYKQTPKDGTPYTWVRAAEPITIAAVIAIAILELVLIIIVGIIFWVTAKYGKCSPAAHQVEGSTSVVPSCMRRRNQT